MLTSERRSARRLIMKVPLKFRPVQAPEDLEQDAASMNICTMAFISPRTRGLLKGS